ncbi:MAG: transposase, partial [Deinococcus sp.]|nr:transposase [Deinococcus sp.]
MARVSVTLRQVQHTLCQLGVPLDPVQAAYTQGLIGSERKSARAISTTTRTPYHATTLTRHLGTQEDLTLSKTQLHALVATQAAQVNHPDGVLVVDFTALAHDGQAMEAVSRVWDNAVQRVVWGHKLVVVGVAPPQGFVPLLARYWLPAWA